jgi:hypothetical protein
MRLLSFALLMLLSAPLALSEEVVLGVSPGRIKLDNLLPGQVLSREVTLSSHGPLNLLVRVTKSGEPWVSVNDSLTLRAGGSMTLPVRIRVPQSSLPGNYDSELSFRGRINGTSFSTDLVIPLNISYTVTDKAVQSLSIHRMSLASAENMLVAAVDVENLGNGADRPKSVEIELHDVKGIGRIYRGRSTESIQVPAFGRENISFNIPLDPAPGVYWASMTAGLDDSVVTERTVLEIPKPANRALSAADKLWHWMKGSGEPS